MPLCPQHFHGFGGLARMQGQQDLVTGQPLAGHAGMLANRVTAAGMTHLRQADVTWETTVV